MGKLGTGAVCSVSAAGVSPVSGGIIYQPPAYCMYCRCAVIPADLQHLTAGLKVVLIIKL